MRILRKLFWLSLFAVLTFCFVILFEKGTSDFKNNALKQWQELSEWVVERTHPASSPAQEPAATPLPAH